MSNALIGLTSVFRDTMISPMGKSAILWFDKVILQTPIRGDVKEMIMFLQEKGVLSKATASELQTIWVPIQDFLPEEHRSGFILSGPTYPDSSIDQVIEEVVMNDIRRRYPEEDISYEKCGYGIVMNKASLVASILAWAYLNQQVGCYMLADSREGEVLRKIFSVKASGADFDTFFKIYEALVPDYSRLSWDRLIDLRHHQYLETFRNKVQEMNRMARSKDSVGVAKIAHELLLRDLVEIAKLTKPDVLSTNTLKLVASNMPLPIPVNPLSLLLGFEDIRKQKNLSDRFGWLYFLLDLGDITSPKKHYNG